METIDNDCGAASASYRKLVEIYHDLLSVDDLDRLLNRIAQTVRTLIPVSSLLIAEALTEERVLRPLVADGEWPPGFLEARLPFGEGLIGVAVERGRPILSNDAHLDPRAGHVQGTPEGEPEAIASIPLVARGVVIGAMSLYREGEDARFSDFEFELAQGFADAATLALENARIRRELRDLAIRDELTGLLNRRGFIEHVTQAFESFRRAATPFSILIVDLDDFKRVNDEHGHLCGDHLLREVAAALSAAGRPDNVVCRLGGDEFAVILNGAGSVAASEDAARIKAAVTGIRTSFRGKPVSVEGTVGVAAAGDAAMSVEDLLHAADVSLYASKPPTQTLTLVRRG